MFASRSLVLGTHNIKKARELQSLLEPRGLQVLTLADFDNAILVEEKGATFAENAVLKASQQARHLKRWVLAEDSGLSVDALGGKPGVHSARFSGEDATDASNNQLLLRELDGTPAPQRTAHYVCHVALADAAGIIRLECEATCSGRIRDEPAGDAGFGYDPLFEIVEYHRTFGELGDAVKSLLSHRGRALRLVIPELLEIAASGHWR
jgi:XTP/dITP diphosphohydrolase